MCIRLNIRWFFGTKLHVRDQQIGDDLLYSLHEKKEHPESYKAKLGLFKICFVVVTLILIAIFWPCSSGLHRAVKMSLSNKSILLLHHHMAVSLLGPWKKREKKESKWKLHKNAANGENICPGITKPKKFNSELCGSLVKVTTMEHKNCTIWTGFSRWVLSSTTTDNTGAYTWEACKRKSYIYITLV